MRGSRSEIRVCLPKRQRKKITYLQVHFYRLERLLCKEKLKFSVSIFVWGRVRGWLLLFPPDSQKKGEELYQTGKGDMRVILPAKPHAVQLSRCHEMSLYRARKVKSKQEWSVVEKRKGGSLPISLFL